MGYTHYMTTDKSLTTAERRHAALECSQFLIAALEKLPADFLEKTREDDHSCIIREFIERKDIEGLASAWLKLGYIWLQPYDTETVFLPFDKYESGCFCKTRGPNTPSDSLVVGLFLAMQEAVPSHKRLFSSDGEPDELVEAIQLYRMATGKKPTIYTDAYLSSFTEPYQYSFRSALEDLERNDVVILDNTDFYELIDEPEDEPEPEKAHVHYFSFYPR